MKRFLIPLLATLALPTAVNAETYLRLGVGSLKKDSTTTGVDDTTGVLVKTSFSF